MRRSPLFWWWFSKCTSGPAVLAQLGDLLEMQFLFVCFFQPTLDLLNQYSVDRGSAIYVSRNPPGESDAHEGIRATGKLECAKGSQRLLSAGDICEALKKEVVFEQSLRGQVDFA